MADHLHPYLRWLDEFGIPVTPTYVMHDQVLEQLLEDGLRVPTLQFLRYAEQAA